MVKSHRLSIVLAITGLLLTSLACQAVTRMFEEDTRGYAPESPDPGELPTEDKLPQISDSESLICPDTTADILEAATLFYEGDAEGQDTEEPEEQYLVTYTVSGNFLTDPYYEEVSPDLNAFQQDETRHSEIWYHFTHLIPVGERSALAEYSIVTDGEGNLLAAVGQTAYDPNAWGLEIDISDSDDRLNLTYTLIHEFAHLLTLGPDQVTPSLQVFNNPDDEDIYFQEASSCPQYFPGEGCALPDSYINTYYNLFWADIHEEWQDINLIEDDDQYYQALDDFYFAYEDHFVTDYAATNLEEDVAEAFTFFVLSPRPNGAKVSDDKIRFFYSYPELVRLRGNILNGVCELYQ